jgi:hypothetical protein
MAASPVFFATDQHKQMDDLLWRICEQIQLTPSCHQLAVDRYEAVCRWLEADGSGVASYRPSIYPQGSMRIGTTVRPIGRNEYDLDFVCEVLAHPSSFSSPFQLLKLMEARLREHKVYASILEVKNRCVRLNYADEFHMDILPACPDGFSNDGCLVVPDRESRWWKPSNPKGYADWFEQRCELAMQVLMAERARLVSKAEPIPDQEAAEDKATLKRAVQLLKRWRDIRYEKQPDVAPISMVLTTLAALNYEGQGSVSRAISDILDRIVTLIGSRSPRIIVLNPAHTDEDLSERWENPVQYAAFVTGIRELHRLWADLMAMSGIQNVTKALEKLFGEPAMVAVAAQANRLQKLRVEKSLRVMPAGLISAAPAIGLAMRSNTFHGN